ncbi:hypothetical protein RM780_25340 [Streptomyces sp. DSM 44917]|uniref:Uncharacterized protein n=1 Tax=Streptomyces boetiae TaxID=3075541 RepID=A0ABU2LG85_9ACTN|nr:hypothetical protein [Streptomyces sp. DSM 44917]MDT0310252.1 hypothetical protein [Streptomyces sp. DSM 44917]
MGQDKKRKAELRQAQRDTGQRYTRLARETRERTGRGFRLAELLAECATFPRTSPPWPAGGPDGDAFAPDVFASQLLGEPVPFGTVLALAGALSEEGPQARLVLESVRSGHAAVVACGARRFQLVLSQDMANELCRTPRCGSQMVNWAIVYCSSHLAACRSEDLVAMAQTWGYALYEEAGQTPERGEGSHEADLLVQAAVPRGAFREVSTAFLHACFEDPQVLDEEFWDPDRALAVRHAMAREELRLLRVAERAARRIRQAAGACEGCGADLPPTAAVLHLPPQFCSRACAPPPPPSAPMARPSPWDANL